jgi:hypothetical protein
MKILKYPLELVSSQRISMPTAAQILSVQMQQDRLVLWALVQEERRQEGRSFDIYGTGEAIDIDRGTGKYVATVQQNEFVWHIFDTSENSRRSAKRLR